MLPLQNKDFSAELLSRTARVQAPSVLSLDNALAPMKGSVINGGTLSTHNLFCSLAYKRKRFGDLFAPHLLDIKVMTFQH